jgi:predicted nucleotidyltransferase
MDGSNNIFQSIERAAHEHKLPFVVIGGLAVIEHGYSRATTDFDILISQADKDAWHSLLLELGYKLDHEKEAFRQYTIPDGSVWPVDLMLVAPATFQGMATASHTCSIQGARMQFASLEHLLALKLHALKYSHVGRFLKDFEDIIQLVRSNRMDLHTSAIKDLFLKYGNADLYGKICRACEQQ